MTRRFINDLAEHEGVDEIFLVVDKQLRTNRNGNLYLQLRLSDKSGAVAAMMWNANQRIFGSFEAGEYLRVQGATQIYNSSLQLIVSRIEVVSADQIDESDFTTLDQSRVERLQGRLSEILRDLADQHLRSLAESFLGDENFMSRFVRAPAGISNHHAYLGGLLHHVVDLLELVLVVAPRYPDLDRDLLLMGAFLHDIGKVDELTFERDLGYSDAGQLMGHLVIGVEILSTKIQEAEALIGEGFPQELALALKHMIVSHHGQYEFGSPKLPMTLEALALHHLDNLDAKLHSVLEIVKNEVGGDTSWTAYQPGLGRKIYRGNREASGE